MNDLIPHQRGAGAGLTLSQAVDKMKGPRGTEVKLKLLRNKRDTVDVTIVRDIIRPPVVRAQKEGDDIGYLRIGSFNEQTNEGLKKEIARLTSEIGADKLKGFILDLRNNPVACWIRRSSLPTASSKVARSFQRAARPRIKPAARSRSRATSPTARRWWC